MKCVASLVRLVVVVSHLDTPLPSALRSRLKWKMSTITPNVIKHCISRIGFTQCTSKPLRHAHNIHTHTHTHTLHDVSSKLLFAHMQLGLYCIAYRQYIFYLENVISQHVEGNGWLGYWGKHMRSQAFRGVRHYQKVNHFPGSFEIGRKDRLWRNLSKLQSRVGRKVG